ncbi:COP9 signalosome complex subunit 9-like [Clavelina lepadiformis]|uniref:COP9 signalosome complex subunit 9-like n=1 Tax=Clavelina lepadiformis TaxID=159417 RepID=UPI004042ED2F
MKPVADEMFPDGTFDGDEASVGSSVQMMDTGVGDKAVHSEFYNNFDDLFDDDNLD